MINYFQLLGYALIPAATMTLAGIWATLRVPGENTRSALMHFAAGVVFAVVAVEFLPDLVHEHSVLATAVGFTLGTAAMLGVRLWSETRAKKNLEKSETASGSLIVATAVDIVVDGLMLGIGFAAGAKQGILLTVALAFELISLGLAVVLELKQGRISRGRILSSIIALSGLFIFGAVAGSAALSLISGALLAGVIAFGAAALLFLVTEELLTEAHEVAENPLLTSAFFVGFLAVFLLELLS
jgi:ZIP family zinc transporter